MKTPVFNSHFGNPESLILHNGKRAVLRFRKKEQTPAEKFDILIEVLKKDRTNKSALKDLQELENDDAKINQALKKSKI